MKLKTAYNLLLMFRLIALAIIIYSNVYLLLSDKSILFKLFGTLILLAVAVYLLVQTYKIKKEHKC